MTALQAHQNKYPVGYADRVALIRAKWKAACNVAQAIYGMDLSKVELDFALKGRCAGKACRRGTLGAFRYFVTLNNDMVRRADESAFAHILEDTVEHELAHIVCFMDRSLGQGHDDGWRRVFAKISGKEFHEIKRCHSEEVVHARGGTYEYFLANGETIRLGERHHLTIQRGATMHTRRSQQRIDKHCKVVLVGMSGRTLETPRVLHEATERVARPMDNNWILPTGVTFTGEPENIWHRPAAPTPAPVAVAPVAPVAPAVTEPVPTPAPAPVVKPVVRTAKSGKPVDGAIIPHPVRGGFTYWWAGKGEAWRDTFAKCQAFGLKKYGNPGFLVK